MASHQNDKLIKLVSYILIHRPDEFGLVPDEGGFVSLKDLHRAIIEEEGWSYVRKAHLIELVNQDDMRRYEIIESRIRAVPDNPGGSKIVYKTTEPPKVLYYGATRKSYPFILQKGLTAGEQYVHLASSIELAMRIGLRRDSKPVLLTINARNAYLAGTVFYSAGELIYLVDNLPVIYLNGPPLVKEKKRKENKPPPEKTLELPGSFFMDPGFDSSLKKKKAKRKGVTWKREARNHRRK